MEAGSEGLEHFMRTLHIRHSASVSYRILFQGILGTVLLLSASSSYGVEKICQTLMSREVGGLREDLSQFDVTRYEKPNSVLFLSDGVGGRADEYSMGELVSAAYPDKYVVSADFKYAGPPQKGGLRLRAVDNTEALPFASDSFDRVVLRRGLCVCENSACCGGFLPASKKAESFFRETVRILNKKNPDARIFLHGTYNVSETILDAWRAYLEKIEKEFGVRAIFYHSDADTYFMMIGIQPNPR